MNIWSGTGENAHLSNLAGRPFKDAEDHEYISVEHAYQSLKSGEFDADTYRKPWFAGRKIIGRKGTKTTNNWNLDLMKDLIRQSFQANPEARQALIATGNVEFTHNQDNGVWKEAFPRILAEIRTEFQGQEQSISR